MIGEKKPKEKVITIVVNGTAHEWPKNEEISYEDVVKFDDPTYPQNPPMIYSIVYTDGHPSHPDGTLPPRGSIRTRDGMVFTVTPTGQS